MRPVVFLDSGVGGLPYHRRFLERNPGVPLVYVADTRHFPYGPKPKETLVQILLSLTAALCARFNPCLVVIACNTASVTALEALRAAFPAVAFVGTVPAVRPAVLCSATGRVGVLGTARTIADPYLEALSCAAARERGAACALCHLAAPELVDFVENGFWDADDDAKMAVTRTYIDYFRAQGTDGIVLGCTHFLFLLDFFKSAAGKGMAIYDSVDGVCKQAERLLGHQPADVAGAVDAAGAAYLTGGAPSGKWERVAAHCRLRVQALELSV